VLFEIVTFNIDGIKRKHSRPSKLAGVAQQFGGNLSHLTCDYLIVRDQNTYPFRGGIEARRVIKTWVVLSWQGEFQGEDSGSPMRFDYRPFTGILLFRAKTVFELL
jgi:hypothetical protein